MSFQIKYVVGIGPFEACQLLSEHEMDFLIQILNKLLIHNLKLDISYSEMPSSKELESSLKDHQENATQNDSLVS
jgi:hypothetical protein